MKSCESAVNYYHSLLRFGIMPGLERISALCAELGEPQKGLRYVHVAGTNGKGSVCTELASVFKAAGYSTGLFTSPYVIDFRERIILDGEMISPDDLIEVTEKVRSAVEKLADKGIFPTEFEAITAAAFLYFKQKNCDVVVLETGLGGRFDATNIIEDPLLCVITSVSLDHTAVLGDTVEKIAYEKAGIIKRGVPVITSAEQPDEVLQVIKMSADSNGSVFAAAEKSDIFNVISRDISGTLINYNGTDIKIPFPGDHQIENAAIVIKASEMLEIDVRSIKYGIEKAFIPARTEILSRSPLIILDGSHNDGSTEALAAYLKEFLGSKRILAVMGIMADKDHRAVLGNLLGLFTEVICVTPSNPRAMDAEGLCEKVKAYNLPCEAIKSPTEGVKTALSKIDGYDAVVICGSLYLAGDVRKYTIDLINKYYLVKEED